MPTRLAGLFEKYEFSPGSEERIAKCFTSYQLMYLQTELATAIQLQVAVSAADYPDANQYVKAVEYYRGQVEILQQLINTHDILQGGIIEEQRSAESNAVRMNPIDNLNPRG